MDSIKGIAYSGIGGFALGIGATTAFLISATFKTAGPSLIIFPLGGLLFSSAAVVGKVADEILKSMGWINYPNTRLLTAHVIAAVAMSAAAAMLLGGPLDFCIISGVLLAITALGVNLVVKDLLAS